MQSFPTEKYTFVYKRQDGTVNTYVTSGPIVDKPHYFTAYKYSREHQQYGIRSFIRVASLAKSNGLINPLWAGSSMVEQRPFKPLVVSSSLTQPTTWHQPC